MPPQRLCPVCSAAEPVRETEPVWPAGWTCRACGHEPSQIDGVIAFAPELADTLSGFDPRSFDELSRNEDGHYWFEPRNRLITGLIRRHFPETKRYLEVGCGTGFVLQGVHQALPAAVIAASEVHPTGLSHARRRLADASSITFLQMDARQIPAREAFDLVGAYDVIEHIEEDERVLAELHGALAPGGGAVIAVPQHPFLWSAVDDLGHHVRRYARGELESKMRRAGFDILFSSSYTAVLLPLMAASRVRRERPEALEDLLKREYDVPSWLNRLLKGALQAEVSCTLAGLPWPAGGSRIVVARKAAQ
jgi:SAM-dependent methyltransferase